MAAGSKRCILTARSSSLYSSQKSIPMRWPDSSRARLLVHFSSGEARSGGAMAPKSPSPPSGFSTVTKCGWPGSYTVRNPVGLGPTASGVYFRFAETDGCGPGFPSSAFVMDAAGDALSSAESIFLSRCSAEPICERVERKILLEAVRLSRIPSPFAQKGSADIRSGKMMVRGSGRSGSKVASLESRVTTVIGFDGPAAAAAGLRNAGTGCKRYVDMPSGRGPRGGLGVLKAGRGLCLGGSMIWMSGDATRLPMAFLELVSLLHIQEDAYSRHL